MYTSLVTPQLTHTLYLLHLTHTLNLSYHTWRIHFICHTWHIQFICHIWHIRLSHHTWHIYTSRYTLQVYIQFTCYVRNVKYTCNAPDSESLLLSRQTWHILNYYARLVTCNLNASTSDIILANLTPDLTHTNHSIGTLLRMF